MGIQSAFFKRSSLQPRKMIVGVEKEESEASESIINNSRALCISEDMAS